MLIFCVNKLGALLIFGRLMENDRRCPYTIEA